MALNTYLRVYFSSSSCVDISLCASCSSNMYLTLLFYSVLPLCLFQPFHLLLLYSSPPPPPPPPRFRSKIRHFQVESLAPHFYLCLCPCLCSPPTPPIPSFSLSLSLSPSLSTSLYLSVMAPLCTSYATKVSYVKIPQ